MQYAKLINCEPSFAPREILLGGRRISNPRPEHILAAGFLPVRREDKPDGGYYIEAWREEDGEIVRGWTACELPAPPEPEFTNDDVAEYLGELEYRICLMELGVTEDDLQIMP